MDEKDEWKLSPAYDLTFSSSVRGEQSIVVIGAGKNPSVEHLIKLGVEAELSKAKVREVIDQTKAALSGWSKWVKQQGSGGIKAAPA